MATKCMALDDIPVPPIWMNKPQLSGYDSRFGDVARVGDPEDRDGFEWFGLEP